MTTSNELENLLRGMLREFLDDRRVPAANIDQLSDLDLESVQVMEFMLEVEDHFDIAIDVESFSNARTIQDLAQIVAKRSQ